MSGWLLAASAGFLVGCSSGRPIATDPDASTGLPDAGEPPIDAELPPDDATDVPADAPEVIDTCPPPSAAFATDLPPSPGTNVSRRRATLQVSETGALRAFTFDYYANGSFYDARLVQHARGPTAWTQGSIASAGIGSSIARHMASSHGADPCIAYSNDYDGTLHLRCGAAADRTLAPAVRGALSIAAHGATKHLVYEAASGTLVWQPFDTDPGTAEPLHTGVWVYGPSSVAVDEAGDVHVAYVTIDAIPSGGTTGVRTVRYAVRQGGAWVKQVVDTDTWRYTSGEADTVSLVLAGGQPTIGYHHRATKSLRLAQRTAAGDFTTRTLVAPDPGFASDVVGSSLALATDCLDRLHLVYQRSVSTDAQPNLGLAYARITPAGLEDKVALPMTASTAFRFAPTAYGLGFAIGADGRQFVAAQIGGVYGTALYVATR